MEEPLWAAFAWLLLVLLTLFFLPGALDPIRYPASAWLTVISWAAGAIFFLVWYTAEYRAFGVVALILFVVQAPLLFFALRAMPRPAESRSRPATEVTAADIFEYDGSTFHEVKEVAFAGEYERLPYYRGLDLATMLQFFNGSARNLADRDATCVPRSTSSSTRTASATLASGGSTRIRRTPVTSHAGPRGW